MLSIQPHHIVEVATQSNEVATHDVYVTRSAKDADLALLDAYTEIDTNGASFRMREDARCYGAAS